MMTKGKAFPLRLQPSCFLMSLTPSRRKINLPGARFYKFSRAFSHRQKRRVRLFSNKNSRRANSTLGRNMSFVIDQTRGDWQPTQQLNGTQ